MPWTSLAIVKKHLQSSLVPPPDVFDEEVILVGTDDSQLLNTNIDVASESLKILQVLDDVVEIMTLVANIPALFTYPRIKRDSLSCEKSAPGPTVFYVPEADFVLEQGRTGFPASIARASIGSSMPDPETVRVFYLPYTVLTPVNDYIIDYDNGLLRRAAGTTIPDGAHVFIDYSHAMASITDTLISEAILEAEAFMLDKSPSLNPLSTAQNLISAATYYALSIICLSQAGKLMTSTKTSDTDNIAEQWMALHKQYGAVAAQYFSKSVKCPLIDLYPGGVINNRYTSTRTHEIQIPSISVATRRR
jgi:hypothetical protein